MASELITTPLFYDTNLVAYYRFEDGALTTDTKNGHTLTAVSDPANDTSGQFNNACAFDGNDAYSAVDHADFKPTGAFTIGGWIKCSSGTGTQYRILQSYSANANIAGIFLGIDSTASGAMLRTGKNSGTVAGTDYQQIVGSTDVTTGSWVFIVGTWDASNLNIYVNGASDATAVAWANAPVYAATNYVRVACQNNTGTDGTFFTGSLDDLFLLKGKALSATEISNIYNDVYKSGFLPFL